jgi:hypothetical protein
MDTDDLSVEAYHAVILTAERFHHDLTLQFGVLAADCDDEEEYLNECLKLIRELKRLKRDQLSDVFFDNEPDITEFKKALDQIKEAIDRVKSIDVSKRKFDRW